MSSYGFVYLRDSCFSERTKKYIMRLIAITQGIYFLLTGIWPLVSIETFQKVTGPKRDLWLVKTVGLLIAVVGLSLLVAGWRGEIDLEVMLLAIGSAAALMSIDVIYVFRRTISPIYLMDALLELFIIGLWVLGIAAEAIFS